MLPSSRRLLVLDDDPTGSQCVSQIPVAFEEDTKLIHQTLADPSSACFVLTNSRALDEEDAVAKNRRILTGVLADFGENAKSAGLHLDRKSVV